MNVFTDEKITIDQVIQQLGELIPQWEELGRAADIQPSVLKEVSETNMDMCMYIHASIYTAYIWRFPYIIRDLLPLHMFRLQIISRIQRIVLWR